MNCGMFNTKKIFLIVSLLVAIALFRQVLVGLRLSMAPVLVLQQHQESKTAVVSNTSTCSVDSSGNWTESRTVPGADWNGSRTLVPVYGRLDEFLDGVQQASSPNSSSEEAICDFMPLPHSVHFPHAMQQLLRCWSYWKAHPTKRPVLVFPRPHRGWPDKTKLTRLSWVKRVFGKYNKPNYLTEFLPSFIHLLQQEFGVTLRAKLPNETTRGAVRIKQDGYALLSPTDVQPIHEALARKLKIPSSSSCHSSCNEASGPPPPRIAILSRTKSRKMLNADELVAALEAVLPTSRAIPVVYFDNATFLQQVQFFLENDIVISPHGAQLTGIAFMSSRCGSILEIFPDGYCLPYYFGSLAVACSLHHSYIPLGKTGECTLSEKRGVARSVQICPPIDILIEGVQKLVDQFRACCCATAAGHDKNRST